MLSKLTSAAALLATLTGLLAAPSAQANGGWDWEWDFAPNPWQIDAMDWTLEVNPELSETDVVGMLPPPSDPSYCTVAGCTDTQRMDEFVMKLFKDAPPSDLPAYPLGCDYDCIWTP